jgi:hypothetical protein
MAGTNRSFEKKKCMDQQNTKLENQNNPPQVALEAGELSHEALDKVSGGNPGLALAAAVVVGTAVGTAVVVGATAAAYANAKEGVKAARDGHGA